MKKAEKVVQTLKNGQDKENTTSSIFLEEEARQK